MTKIDENDMNDNKTENESQCWPRVKVSNDRNDKIDRNWQNWQKWQKLTKMSELTEITEMIKVDGNQQQVFEF